MPCCNLVLLRVEAVEVDDAVALVEGLCTTATGLGSMVLSGVTFNSAAADDPTRCRLLARSLSSNSPFRLTRRLNRPVRTPAVGIGSTLNCMASCLWSGG